RITAPLVNEDRFTFAVLIGVPQDPDWKTEVADEAARLMQETAERLIPASQMPPRRGPHRTETVGLGMGGGQEEPTPFFHLALNRILLANLLAQQPFQRIAGFINGMFLTYAPDLHGFYRSTMRKLHKWKPGLPRNFDALTSVFAAATFNFGPQTVMFPHLDLANLAWGWCSITALGNFDPNKGGHLILWDLRLVIRFPLGSSIMIPSAILRNSNVSLQQGETCFSFTQFTSAGLFCFVGNDFRTDKSIEEGRLSATEKAKRAEERHSRWAEGLKMYSKWDVAVE
ncbi:hypothetical protein B0H13DRAFT_1643939, partial [Mycena leptocephala]